MSLWIKSESETIQMKASEQPFITGVALNFCGCAIFFVSKGLIFAIRKDCFFIAGNLFLRFPGSRVQLGLQHFHFLFEHMQ